MGFFCADNKVFNRVRAELHVNSTRGKQIKWHMVLGKFRSSGHQWRKGVVFDFSLTREEKVGGWWARPKARGRRGTETAASSASHLIFPTVFGLFTSGSRWQVPSLCSDPNRRQVAGSQAGLWGLSANQWPTWASMTISRDLHVVTNPLPNCWWAPSFSPLLSHTPSLPSYPFLASLQGATVTVKDQEPYWRSF